MTDENNKAHEAPGSEEKRSSDCYSQGERQWMDFGRDVRLILLSPFLPLLRRSGITPDHITLVAGFLGVLFLPLWLLDYCSAAFCALALHVILDGVDGPLARYTGAASSRGSFTDSFADQVVVTAVAIAWMGASPSVSNICLGSSYIFLYAAVVAIAMVRNALQIPYSWLVRPRFFVYIAMLLEYLTALPFVPITMCISILLLGWKTTTGFIALRSKI